jgi:tetratricopeptide (TPR) repeat protein
LRDALKAGALLLIVAAAYVPAMRAGFVWDDDAHVTANRTFGAARGLADVWTGLNRQSTTQYYPLTFTVFWLQHALWGFNAAGYHAVNILLHGCNAILLWRLWRRLRIRGAWIAAAVFGVHPVNVMSVAWITELKNVLCGFFMLASLHAYLGHERRRVGGASRAGWMYLLSLALCFCALASKTAAAVTVVALACLIRMERPLRRGDAFRLLPFAVLAALFGGITIWVEQSHVWEPGRVIDYTTVERLLRAARTFWFYAYKIVWPFPVVFLYPEWHVSARDPASWGYLVALVAVIGLLWRARAARGYGPLLAALYFFAAAPALVLVQTMYMMQYTPASDHWQYFANPSLIALLAAAGAGAARAPQVVRPWRVALCAALLGVLAAASFRQCRDYRDEETLWRATLAKNPRAWMAYNNLAVLLLRQGRIDESRDLLSRLARLNPRLADTHNNLGVLHLQQALRRPPGPAAAGPNAWENIPLPAQGAPMDDEQLLLAKEEFQRALEIDGRNASALYHLGLVSSLLGRAAEAIDYYQKALGVRPWYPEALNNLGLLHLRNQQAELAARCFAEALRLKPDSASIHNNMATALIELGKTADARAHLEQAYRLDPLLPEPQKRMGLLEAKEGNLAVAALWFRGSLALDARDPDTLYNLGMALAMEGDRPAAISNLQAALAVKPDFTDARHKVGLFLAVEDRGGEAMSEFEEALRLKPDAPDLLNDFAWFLATTADDALRNGARAVQLAERACRISGRRNAGHLDTLAAAYAEAGRYREAAETAREAADVARRDQDDELAAAVEGRAALYEQRLPYRRHGRMTDRAAP